MMMHQRKYMNGWMLILFIMFNVFVTAVPMVSMAAGGGSVSGSQMGYTTKGIPIVRKYLTQKGLSDQEMDLEATEILSHTGNPIQFWKATPIPAPSKPSFAQSEIEKQQRRNAYSEAELKRAMDAALAWARQWQAYKRGHAGQRPTLALPTPHDISHTLDVAPAKKNPFPVRHYSPDVVGNCPDCGVEVVQLIHNSGNNPLDVAAPTSSGTSSGFDFNSIVGTFLVPTGNCSPKGYVATVSFSAPTLTINPFLEKSFSIQNSTTTLTNSSQTFTVSGDVATSTSSTLRAGSNFTPVHTCTVTPSNANTFVVQCTNSTASCSDTWHRQ